MKKVALFFILALLCATRALAQDQDLHTEPTPACGHQLPDGAQAVDAERGAAQAVRQRARPLAAFHAFGLERHVAA